MLNLLLTPRVLGFVVGTRVMLGIGIGLLAASRIPESRRRQLALTLIGAGLATTIPAARALRRSRTQQQQQLQAAPA
jgi:hypothetical protein